MSKIEILIDRHRRGNGGEGDGLSHCHLHKQVVHFAHPLSVPALEVLTDLLPVGLFIVYGSSQQSRTKVTIALGGKLRTQ